MKKTITNSLFIITFFSVLDRALGFLFKIFMSRTIGAEGVGLYQIAFSFFSVLLSTVVGGIPLVVSKLVARSQDSLSQNKIAGSALLLALSISALLVGLFFTLYYPLCFAMGKTTLILVICMLPTLIFSSVYCSLRGFLWGKEKFFAVSIVEVIEQISRIGICVAMFLFGFDKLRAVAISLSAGSLVSSIACFIFFFANHGKLKSSKSDFLKIAKSSFPITISNLIGSLSGSITSLLVPKLFIWSGYTSSQANALLGSSLGMAMPLVFIPITLVSSLAFVLIPKISNEMKNNDYLKINNSVVGAIKFATLVACCLIPIFSAGGRLLCKIVYDNEQSGEFLSFIAFALLPLTVENITGSILNSLDMEMKNFINGMIGYSMIWVVALVSIGNYSVYSLGCGFALSWTLSAILNIRCIVKKTGLSLSFLPYIIKNLLLCAPTILLGKNMLQICSSLHPLLNLSICSIISVAFFAILSLVFGSVSFTKISTKRKRKKIKV
ncbi:MAG: oligosaccharide flippase family protein [Clostridia bacterium]|nr:oligosaccharide flippase family protein [Clostridia bacterium]